MATAAAAMGAAAPAPLHRGVLGLHAVGAARMLLLACLAAQLPASVLAYGSGKKSKFLEVYPMIFKFFMFWWCVAVFIILVVYIIDHLITKFRGPQRVDFVCEHAFRSVAGREAYWAQLADPSAWKPTHPVLQSADVRMVEFLAKEDEKSGAEDAAGAAAASADDGADEGDDAPAPEPAEEADKAAESLLAKEGKRVRPIPLRTLKPGLGMILRHKAGTPRAGGHFCTRECTSLETPNGEEPWRLVMRTVDVGGGYPFAPGTEESTVDMWPAAEDGTIRCVIIGRAACGSRLFNWWHKLQDASELGAQAMLEAIGEEVGRSKKRD